MPVKLTGWTLQDDSESPATGQEREVHQNREEAPAPCSAISVPSTGKGNIAPAGKEKC